MFPALLSACFESHSEALNPFHSPQREFRHLAQLCELCCWKEACNCQAPLCSEMLISVYEAEFWVLMTVIIREGMYRHLARQNSTVALEPLIGLLMQSCGANTWLWQKLLINPFRAREVPKRGYILRGRGGIGQIICSRNSSPRTIFFVVYFYPPSLSPPSPPPLFFSTWGTFK